LGAAATLRQDLWTKWLVARARRDFLENLVTTGAASHDDHSSWEKSVAECATVEAELAAKRETLFEAGTESLSTDSTATLARIRAQRSRDTLPVHLLVVERSDADWNRLEEAYRRAAEAKRAGEELDPDLESFIEEVNFDYPVLQARRNRRELLDGVTAAWELAVRSSLAMAEVEGVGVPEAGGQAPVATPLSSPAATPVATPVTSPDSTSISTPE
jgi:hypothetical protein